MSLRPAAAAAAIARAASIAVHGVQPLEPRLLWSVSYDTNGYTVVTPDSNSRLVYVSSSGGSDSNSGLSPAAPVATIAKAETLLRNGMPDEILFKRGDVFHDYFGYNWQLSGEDAADPMVIGAYGTGPRPLIDSGANTWAINVGGSTPVSYLDVLGIAFEPLLRDPTSTSYVASAASTTADGTTGFRWYSPGGDVLIQDCSFKYYMYNLDIETWPFSPVTSPTGFTISRDVVSDSYALNGHSEGLYASNINDLTITQCVFDHDGWNASISGAQQQGYNHDIYVSFDVTDVTVQDCVLAEASFAGIMARSGGNIDDNLFVNDVVAVSFGNANGADSTTGGVTGSLVGNAVVGDAALGTTAWGEGFEIGNTTPGAGLLVADNTFTGDTQHAQPAIYLTMATATLNPTVCVGDNDVTIEDNVFNGWQNSVMVDGRFVPGGTGLYALTDLKILDNDFLNASASLVRSDSAYFPAQEVYAGNRYYDPGLSASSWVALLGVNIGISAWLAGYDTTGSVLSALPYADPTRTVATYDSAQDAVGTVADFLTQAQLISSTNYQTQYMAQSAVNYVRAGFTADTTAPTAAAAAATVNLTSLGATAYTFTVTYTDNALLNASTIGAGDVLVTGPNGFAQAATFVSATTATVTTAGGQQIVATYKITPPGGAWAAGEDGTYAVSLLAKAVADAAGNVTAAGGLTTFTVDLTAPTAVAAATAITTAGGTSYTFTVTYNDADGIKLATLDSKQVVVTGPNGYSVAATLTGTATSGTSVTATYAIAPADGAWSAADAGTYTVALASGDPVLDNAGNAAAAGTLTTFPVETAASPTGNLAGGTISGYAYIDANANGTYDAREVPLAGVTVFLDVAGTGKYVSGDPTTTTAADGSYSFAGVATGKYTVMVVTPAGYQATSAASQVVTVASGATVANIDFGLQVKPTAVSSGSPRPISLHGSGLTVGATGVAAAPVLVP